jgi:UDP:flavonoid glycosyltransferase YjiC (YdhE family)
MVLLPQAADQFENAAQVAALGAGLALLPEEVDEESLLTSVATLLADASYAEHARAVADEIAAMPAAADVAAMLSA